MQVNNDEREYIRVHELDGTRSLLIPSTEPRKLRGYWPNTEFERLKKNAHIVTLQDRIDLLEEAHRKKCQLQDESMQRKQQLQSMQAVRKPKIDNKLVEVEREAKRQNLYLLKRSYELLQEQDERAKAANRLILATKCRAIRNAQIAEKELIRKQMAMEDKRLDMMMEQQRQEEVKCEERRREQEQLKKQTYVKELSCQIKLNETEKLLEAERAKEESRILNKMLIAIQKEEEEKLLEKKRLQIQMRDALHQSKLDNEKYKYMKAEEDKIASMRIQAFMKKKQEREDERDRQLAVTKLAKEKEIARLRVQQESQQDQKAELNEINAARIQEEMERKWRENELKKAQKRKEDNDALKRDRQKQIDDINRGRAVRLTLDEQDFHKVTNIQKELYAKEMQKKAKTKEESMKHCHDLLKQITEKEQLRIKEQRDRFQEGKYQRIEQELKDRRVNEYLQEKIDKLRENDVLKNYVQDIENQLKSQFGK